MDQIRVGVLRGGPSNEYEVSLKSGATVLKHLPNNYRPVDIFIDKEGNWHMHGVQYEPHEIFPHIDVVFNAMHGEYGEDGTVQELLEKHGIAFTGAGQMASKLAMNKAVAKNILASFGIKTPIYKILTSEDQNQNSSLEIFRTFPMPVVIKPMSSGSSVGVRVARTFAELESALQNAFEYSDEVLIEEFIQGREATCGVIDGFRGEEFYSLPPIEIIPHIDSPFFDYEAKYGGKTQEICPGNFSREETEIIRKMATVAHKELGLRHYSRSDFIVHPRRGIFFLEVNTLPGMTEESLFPKALKAIGSTISEFLHHVVGLTGGKR